MRPSRFLLHLKQVTRKSNLGWDIPAAQSMLMLLFTKGSCSKTNLSFSYCDSMGQSKHSDLGNLCCDKDILIMIDVFWVKKVIESWWRVANIIFLTTENIIRWTQNYTHLPIDNISKIQNKYAFSFIVIFLFVTAFACIDQASQRCVGNLIQVENI